LVVTLSKNWLTARAEASRARIVSLRESPIRWPRIDDPVGLRLDIELEHTMSPRGILYPPQVRMDGPEVPSPKGYFGTRGRSALGVSPWRQPDAAPPPSPARLVYELYPPAVMLLSAGEWICLEESPVLDVPCTDGGYHLGAIWFAARAAGASRGLSEPLPVALRRASFLPGSARPIPSSAPTPTTWRGWSSGCARPARAPRSAGPKKPAAATPPAASSCRASASRASSTRGRPSSSSPRSPRTAATTTRRRAPAS